MKQKLQKYLSGEREGFSLVELIIVIAIMAILIGIVALAVIPYLEKSRVGKDQQTVDTVYSAFQAAIADQQISTDIKVEIKSDGTGVATPANDSFVDSMAATLNATDHSDIGKGTAAKLESADAKGKSIICTYDAATKTITAEVTGTSIKSSNKAS